MPLQRRHTVKTLLLLATTAYLFAVPALAQEGPVKIGILLGFTGPVESLMPDVAASAEVAFAEASESGLFLGGRTIEPLRADSTCVDAGAATTAAERLITADEVVAIVGADCSGVTAAAVNNVGVPNGIVMISPSATAPSLTDIEDNGLFFRTVPSDDRQGQILAEITKDRGIDTVAVSYTNNDYGKGLSDSFAAAFEALGGEIVIAAAHEDGKPDYAAEVGALAAAGADHLALFGYLDQGGKGILEVALDTGAFYSFILADGMVGDALLPGLPDDISGSFGTLPGSETESSNAFEELAAAAGITGGGPFRGEAYDAAALIVLAMQAAGSADRDALQARIIDVANAPGEPIHPGELAKGLQILADGGDIDYHGATNIELTDAGDTIGAYREVEADGTDFVTVKVR
ncbi:MAG: ABC transporter substrate-binding protein [Hyphomicrobiales bacterium]|nr:ABC transporter substrate-binding protein [Hyphomicrobiales bacterium]